MREFGDRQAARGIVLCEISDCEANYPAVKYPSAIALTMATGHELLKNHKTVVVHYDDAHKVPPLEATEVLRLTGVNISEDIIG